jgi:DNA-directed RNA polymerase subunit alpha
MTKIPISKADEQARLMRERLDLSTAEIGLLVRTTNCLEEKGIFTVRDLLNSRPETLLTIANFGEKTLEEVYQALERLGYYRPESKRPRAKSSSAKSQKAKIEATVEA